VVQPFVLTHALPPYWTVTQGYEPARNEQELTVTLQNLKLLAPELFS
jgi:hypothetical protein